LPFFFRRQSTPPDALALPSIEADERIYAFGDLHGRADLIEALFARIADDRRRAPIATAIVIGLGDYVDRGPNSRAVLDALVRGVPGCTLVALRGNHEQMLLDFLDDPVEKGSVWLANGAGETLASYGVNVGTSGRLPALALRSIRDALAAAMPESHLRFLRALPLTYSAGSYLFVHAGIRPGVSLADQTERDLLWIRKGFADQDIETGLVVVHGHTPVEQPYLGRHRINLDTGAVYSDRLTCLVLEGTTRRLLEI
jgi:serine/threonine protein phosphatase 1